MVVNFELETFTEVFLKNKAKEKQSMLFNTGDIKDRYKE
jgi:hypothetical protein